VDSRRWAIRISSVILIVFIVSQLAYYFLLPGLASFLIIETDDLQPADVVVVLGGDPERVEQGIELYKAGFSPNLIFVGDKLIFYGMNNSAMPIINTTWPKYLKGYAIDSGVTSDAIILSETTSTSTYEDTIHSREIILERGFKSAIIVSDPYHMRRVRWTFSKVFKNDDISLSYKTTEDHWFKENKWWTSENTVLAINNEYIKLVYYRLKY